VKLCQILGVNENLAKMYGVCYNVSMVEQYASEVAHQNLRLPKFYGIIMM
jgi:hypothetical protein